MDHSGISMGASVNLNDEMWYGQAGPFQIWTVARDGFGNYNSNEKKTIKNLKITGTAPLVLSSM